MYYGPGPIGPAAYPVLKVLDLPLEVEDELNNSCPGNDTARVINPDYHPKLKAWLEQNGYAANHCYIGWWSW